MFVSMRGRNVLRLMADLASRDFNDLSKAKEISHRLNLSDRYLEESLSIMKKNGFVKSIRGAKGGYQLRRAASEYTIAEILIAAEGSMSPVPCIDDPDYCVTREECTTIEFWLKVDEAIKEIMYNTTLQDILDWHNDYLEKSK